MLQETYTASCNPARRAKQSRTTVGSAPVTKPTPAPPNPQRNILPFPASPMDGTSDQITPIATPQPGPVKRGRKPGPLSRSARETQRKLNHSIIEKARRTKINDALATLRQLVPTDYGSQPKIRKDADADDGDGDGDGGDDGDWNGGKSEKPKKSAKREEKEKEFKLEILVRTVSFMQDLIARVKVLEEGAGQAATAECPKCAQEAAPPSSKRRHDQFTDDADRTRNDRAKRSRRESPSSAINEPFKDEAYQKQNQQISPPEFAARPYLGSRLPSISSWLPNQIDPVLLSPSQGRLSDTGITQLPSPPSSTPFDPIQTSQMPPVLNLGPVAVSALLSPRRTPEDESAASLLLQISGSSPQVLPVTSSIASITSFDMSKMRTACVTPVKRTGATQCPQTQAQTPGSMLGLVRRA